MSEKILATRILLRYDTLENWSINNPVLKPGEIGLATISDTTSTIHTAPAILFKVGDGTTAWNDLKFGSALASDVYAWAKAASKPVYTATEVGADTAGTAQSLINTLDATVSGMSPAKTISALSQTNGTISATFQDIAISNTQVSGLGDLATANTVGNSEITDVDMSKVTGLESALEDKQDVLAFDGTYNSTSNKVATQATITNAIAALDKTDSAVSNQYVTAVSEANGVITVTRKQIEYSEIADTPTEKTTTFTAGTGLTVSGQDGGTVKYDIDGEDTTFILDCGSASAIV